LGWITDRHPRKDELRMISSGVHPAYGEFFLIWDGEVVDIDFFEISVRHGIVPENPGIGVWHHSGVRAWRPLPPPPGETEIEGE
jgi:hypothetical protein